MMKVFWFETSSLKFLPFYKVSVFNFFFRFSVSLTTETGSFLTNSFIVFTHSACVEKKQKPISLLLSEQGTFAHYFIVY